MPACAPNGGVFVGGASLTSGLSEIALTHLASRMDPAMRALAVRHDPGVRQADLWNRPEGWENLDITDVPDLGPVLGHQTVEGEDAAHLNALRPFADLPIRPMKPFMAPAKG